MLSLALACPDRRMIAVIGIESDHAVAAGEVVKVSLGSHSGQNHQTGPMAVLRDCSRSIDVACPPVNHSYTHQWAHCIYPSLDFGVVSQMAPGLGQICDRSH